MSGKNQISRTILRLIIILACALLLIQLVPYGRSHTNPPVVQEPAWDSPATRSMAKTACFDCHSNETEWPWYANIAPASWLVQRDVGEGRLNLNFSEWGTGGQMDAGKVAEVIRQGEMPPFQYTLIHKEARLSAAVREQFAAGMQKSLEK